jgi:hypothetical protein
MADLLHSRVQPIRDNGDRAVPHRTAEPGTEVLRRVRSAHCPSRRLLYTHITKDERKLTPSDVRLIKTLCSVDERRFRLLSRLETLIGARLRTPTGASRLEIFDRWALDSLTVLGTFAGDVVMICRGNPHDRPDVEGFDGAMELDPIWTPLMGEKAGIRESSHLNSRDPGRCRTTSDP